MPIAIAESKTGMCLLCMKRAKVVALDGQRQVVRLCPDHARDIAAQILAIVGTGG